MKKMWNQIGRPRPPAVDEIKIFDNDNKAAKHSFLSECFTALSSLSKILISSTAGGLGRPIWFHIFFILAFLVLGRYFLHQGCFGWDFTSFFSSISFKWLWLHSFDHTSCKCWHFQMTRRIAWPVHAWLLSK